MTRLRFRVLFLAGFLTLAGISGTPLPVHAAGTPAIGYYDLTRVLAAHPLMNRFDPVTRRFSGTGSQPPKDLNLAIKRAELSIRSITIKLDKLKLHLEQEFKKGGKASSDALQAYWLKRKPIEAELVVEQSRLSEFREMQLMGRSTKNESVVPILDKILEDIRDATGEVAARTGVQLILDVSAINRRQAQSPVLADLSSVQTNLIEQLWQAPQASVSPDALERWLDNAGEIVIHRFPALGCPIPAGGVDLEPGVIRLLHAEILSPRATTNRSRP